MTPYVSSSAFNNGVDNFISNKDNLRLFKKSLTLANSGSVGATFFHNYKFVASDHVTALELKEKNPYVYLFLATLIKRLESKYSFNREINDKRIQRETILLPTDNRGQPDWEYMEYFVKIIALKQSQNILNHLANK